MGPLSGRARYFVGAFRARLSGRSLPHCQLRRQGKANIFANQIEIALVGEAETRQPLAHLLDQNFGSGGAGREAKVA